jgi:hypothetical protein
VLHIAKFPDFLAFARRICQTQHVDFAPEKVFLMKATGPGLRGLTFA